MSGGGSGGGGGGQTTSTNTTQNFSPEEAARRTQVQDEAKRIYDATSGTISNSPYPGSNIVPFSPETTMAQNYLSNYATQVAPGLIGDVNNAVSFGLKDVLYPSTNPALQQTIDASVRPITDQMFNAGGVMDTIDSGAVLNDSVGGSRQGVAQGLAANAYLRNVGDASAKVATEGYNKGLETFGRTLAFAPAAMAMGTQHADLLAAVGGQKETLAQLLEDRESSARMWDLNAEWAPLQNYANIVFGGGNPSTSSTSTGSGTQQRSGGGLGGIIGGAASGFAATGGNPWGAAAGALLSLF